MDEQRQSVLDRLASVFRDTFDDEGLNITEVTTAKDIDEWDSVNHISLVLAVEKEFDVRLSAADVGRLENVGAMLDLLSEKSRS